jgi:hypothetical protein
VLLCIYLPDLITAAAWRDVPAATPWRPWARGDSWPQSMTAAAAPRR